MWKLATATPAPTALVCVNDMTAIGAVAALREGKNYKLGPESLHPLERDHYRRVLSELDTN